MTLQQQLQQDDMACFTRQISRYEEEDISVFPKSSGNGYWLVIKKGTGRNATKQDIECASFEDLVSKLLPGEAESDEWFTF